MQVNKVYLHIRKQRLVNKRLNRVHEKKEHNYGLNYNVTLRIKT